MEAPFLLTPFEEMKEKQAKQYFQWFIQDRENRIAVLQTHIKETGGNVQLDKSVTKAIAVDIANYFEDTFIAHNPTITWGYLLNGYFTENITLIEQLAEDYYDGIDLFKYNLKKEKWYVFMFIRQFNRVSAKLPVFKIQSNPRCIDTDGDGIK